MQGKSDLSIIPIENSIEGSIGVTLDLFLENGGADIVGGEIVVKIEHGLLSKGGPEKIKVILRTHRGGLPNAGISEKEFP